MDALQEVVDRPDSWDNQDGADQGKRSGGKCGADTGRNQKNRRPTGYDGSESIRRCIKEGPLLRILVLNESPRSRGNTTRLVDAFAKGAREAGHTIQIETVALNEPGYGFNKLWLSLLKFTS